VAVWSYCLMPNHVHLIMVPASADGLRAALGEAHRRYTRRINLREGWCGYLWQGRFASVAMDEAHLMAAARYVELNPMRARLAAKAQDWPWSSARAHLEGHDDGLVTVAPLLERETDWRAFLDRGLEEDEHQALRAGERTGRPLGSDAFVASLERDLGRPVARRKPGPKPGPAAQDKGDKHCVPVSSHPHIVDALDAGQDDALPSGIERADQKRVGRGLSILAVVVGYLQRVVGGRPSGARARVGVAAGPPVGLAWRSLTAARNR